jgi:hypothetical protein
MEYKSHTFFNDPNYLRYHTLIENAKKYQASHIDTQPFLRSLNNGDFSLALRQACYVGIDYLVEILLAYMEQVRPGSAAGFINEQSESNGRTALHWAAVYAKKTGKISVLTALLEAQPHPPALRDHEGKLYSDYLDEKLKEELAVRLKDRYVLMDDLTWKLASNK